MEPIRLTPDELRKLQEADAAIKLVEEEIARAERAGLDMTDHKERVKSMKDLRAGLLREYSAPGSQVRRIGS